MSFLKPFVVVGYQCTCVTSTWVKEIYIFFFSLLFFGEIFFFSASTESDKLHAWMHLLFLCVLFECMLNSLLSVTEFMDGSCRLSADKIYLLAD